MQIKFSFFLVLIKGAFYESIWGCFSFLYYIRLQNYLYIYFEGYNLIKSNLTDNLKWNFKFKVELNKLVSFFKVKVM